MTEEPCLTMRPSRYSGVGKGVRWKCWVVRPATEQHMAADKALNVGRGNHSVLSRGARRSREFCSTGQKKLSKREIGAKPSVDNV